MPSEMIAVDAGLELTPAERALAHERCEADRAARDAEAANVEREAGR